VAVRWYFRYGLSYSDVDEPLAERGLEVDHVTVYRWVQRFTPMLADAARHAAGRRRTCPSTRYEHSSPMTTVVAKNLRHLVLVVVADHIDLRPAVAIWACGAASNEVGVHRRHITTDHEAMSWPSRRGCVSRAVRRAHTEPVDGLSGANVGEDVQVDDHRSDDGRWLRKPLVSRVSTSTTMANTQSAAARPGERNGSSASIRTDLNSVLMRRTDANRIPVTCGASHLGRSRAFGGRSLTRKRSLVQSQYRPRSSEAMPIDGHGLISHLSDYLSDYRFPVRVSWAM
jgi:hypothetical protein